MREQNEQAKCKRRTLELRTEEIENEGEDSKTGVKIIHEKRKLRQEAG
jgi:hypothetical protein